MAAADAQTAARVERMGMAMVQPAAGLAALESLVSALSACSPLSASQVGSTVAANPFIWKRFLSRLPGGPPDFLSAFAETGSRTGTKGSSLPATSSAGTASIGSGDGVHSQRSWLASVESQVSATVTAVVGRDVALDASLMEAGLDSLGAVELRNALSESFKVQGMGFASTC